VGIDVLFLQNKRTPAATRKSNHKYTKAKQEIQIINTQTKNKTIKA